MQSPQDKTQTYQYHLKTYGNNVNYDDFFTKFTDKGFDPREWVDLFSDAGAQYFVPTTSTYGPIEKPLRYGRLWCLTQFAVEHHDGFALFNFSTSISKRSSIHYGPKRDIIKDLFAAAREFQPHLRLGMEYKEGKY